MLTWCRHSLSFIVATIAIAAVAAAPKGGLWPATVSTRTIALLLDCLHPVSGPVSGWIWSFRPYRRGTSRDRSAAADTHCGEDLRLRVGRINDLGDPIDFVRLVANQRSTTGEERLEGSGA